MAGGNTIPYVHSLIDGTLGAATLDNELSVQGGEHASQHSLVSLCSKIKGNHSKGLVGNV